MHSRVKSHRGNIIAADFRPEAGLDFDIKSEILFCDEHVCLMRFQLFFCGELIATEHITI